MIGVAGFFVYTLSFALVQLKRLDGNSNRYALMNMTAAAMVLVSLSEAFNPTSALIQVTFMSLGFIGIVVRARSPKMAAPANPSPAP